jgi:hypothetical protein
MPLDARTRRRPGGFSTEKPRPRLLRLAAAAAVACVAAGPLPEPPADAAAAVERGWFGLARELATRAAAPDGRIGPDRAPSESLAALEALERRVLQARGAADARDVAAGGRWNAGDWPQRWQDRHGDERCEAAGIDGLTVAGGLVLWR